MENKKIKYITLTCVSNDDIVTVLFKLNDFNIISRTSSSGSYCLVYSTERKTIVIDPWEASWYLKLRNYVVEFNYRKGELDDFIKECKKYNN